MPYALSPHFRARKVQKPIEQDRTLKYLQMPFQSRPNEKTLHTHTILTIIPFAMTVNTELKYCFAS